MNAVRSLCAVLLVVLPFAAGAADGKDGDDWLRGKLFPPDVVLRHQSQLKLTDAQRQAIRREIVAARSCWRRRTRRWPRMRARSASGSRCC